MDLRCGRNAIVESKVNGDDFIRRTDSFISVLACGAKQNQEKTKECAHFHGAYIDQQEEAGRIQLGRHFLVLRRSEERRKTIKETM